MSTNSTEPAAGAQTLQTVKRSRTGNADSSNTLEHTVPVPGNYQFKGSEAEVMGSTLGSWSQDLDMTMVGTLYCTYMTSWVGSTAAMTSQRGFMREEVVNFRSATSTAAGAVSRQPL